nr:cache domain-containing protein [Bacteroidota bacterium]
MTKKALCVVAGLSSIFLLASCTKNETVVVSGDISALDAQKRITATVTTNTTTGFGAIFTEMIDDSTSRAQFVQAFSDPVRYLDDNSGYFFTETIGGWSVAHPVNKAIQGTYRLNSQDINGKYYHHDFVQTAQYIGYGFVEYYFTDPSTNLIEPKLTFLKIIPGSDWFVASGFYGVPADTYYNPQDVYKKMAMESVIVAAKGIGGVFENYYSDSLERVEFCRNLIKYIRFFDNQSGYFFIYDLDCNNVAHATQPDLQGQNLYDYQDSHGNYVIRDLVAIAENPGYGYYEYYWNSPVSGEEEPKLAYLMRIPGSNYFVGSGIYLE